jgi:hypothetical protein
VGEDMSTGRAKAKAKKKCTNQTIPLRKAFHALQSLDILARALQRSSPIKSGGIILVVVVVVFLVDFFDIRVRSSVDFVVIVPIEHVDIGIGIRRVRICRRSLAYTAKVRGVVACAPAACRICCRRRREARAVRCCAWARRGLG